MIWKSKFVKVKPNPGDVKIKRVFAIFPVRINNNIIFLEKYEVLEVYSEQDYTVQIEDEPIVFKVGKWVTISKRACIK